MEIYGHTRFRKAEKHVQDAILEGMHVLAERIHAYEKQGIEFRKIYNDDKVKYDQHGQFFTFKCNKGKLQLRILYAYFQVDEKQIMLIVDYAIKKKPKKEYIGQFDNWNDVEPMKIFAEATQIEVVE